jgi:hypothetical protein
MRDLDARLIAEGPVRVIAGNRAPDTLLVARRDLPAHSLARISLLPIRLYCFDAEMSGWVREYSSDRVVVQLSGAGAGMVTDEKDELSLGGGTIVRGHLRLSSGVYPLAAHSSHRVVFRDKMLPAQERVLRADSQGELRLDFCGSQMSVEITPAAPSSSNLSLPEQS